MGLYNMLFGVNQLAVGILATLDLKVTDVGRFRDCFVTQDDEIAVYTRNGGGNREHHVWDNHGDDAAGRCFLSDDEGWTVVVDGCKREHPPKIEEGPACGCTGCIITHRLPQHPLYLRDQDDDFDCTYATIFFRFPAEYADDLRQIGLREEWNPSARWLKMLDSLGCQTEGEG